MNNSSSSSSSSSSTNNIINQPEQQQKNHRKPIRRRLSSSSSSSTTTGLLRILCSIYFLSAISVIVVRYNITALDTIDFAHQTIILDDWGQLPHLPPRNLIMRKTKRRRGLHQQQPNDTTTTPKIVFVHVGKTGGTTVGNMLRILCEARTKEDSRQHCFQQWKERHHHQNQNNITTNNTDGFFVPESKLSQYTVGFLHVTGMYPPSAPPSPSDDKKNNVLDEATHYLITLRNPIERVVSWFYYLHPQNCYEDPTSPGKSIPRSNYTLIDKACITKRRILSQQRSTTGAAEAAGQAIEKRFYQDCFPNIHDFAMALQAQPQQQEEKSIASASTTSSNHHHAHAHAATECQQLAIQTLEGYGGPNGFAGHLWANYTYYKHKISTAEHHKKRPKILAVRTEHLWDDLIGIDQMLSSSKQGGGSGSGTTPTTTGGGGEVFQLQKQIEIQQQKQQQQQVNNNNNNQYYHKDKLSATNGEYLNLCCALQEELKVYQDFITDAINLNHNNKIDTLTKVYEQCGGSGTTATTKIQSLEDLKRTCSSLRASAL